MPGKRGRRSFARQEARIQRGQGWRELGDSELAEAARTFVKKEIEPDARKSVVKEDIEPDTQKRVKVQQESLEPNVH